MRGDCMIDWDKEVANFLSQYDDHPRTLTSHGAVNQMIQYLNERFGIPRSATGARRRNQQFSLRVKIAAGYTKNSYGVFVWVGEDE